MTTGGEYKLEGMLKALDSDSQPRNPTQFVDIVISDINGSGRKSEYALTLFFIEDLQVAQAHAALVPNDTSLVQQP